MRFLALFLLCGLVQAQTGFLINPYQFVPFNPATLPALYTWWRADTNTVFSDAGTTPAVNGATVQQWNDSTATANNLAQGTAGSRPTFLTNRVNGLPAINYDGTDDRMTRTYAATQVSPMTFFLVVRLTSIRSPGTFFDGVVNTQRKYFNQDDSAGGNTNQFGNASGSIVAMAGTQATNAWYYYTLIQNGTNSFAWRNSTATYASTAVNLDSTSPNMTGLSMGSTYIPDQRGNFDIAEMLITTNSVSASDRAGVWSYLTNKYALAP